jgi:hypothetical protein
MPFCRFCGAPKENENAACARCSGQPQYYAPQYPVPVPPHDDSRVAVVLIAVIVIVVAVTVVLAAVLYVMVAGFGGGDYETNISGSWTTSELTNSSGQITFNSFTEEIAPTEILINVWEDDEVVGHITFQSDTRPAPSNMTWTFGPPGAEAVYYDSNPDGGLINPGDSIIFHGLKPGATYSFSVHHIPSNTDVAMVGGSSFTTGP